MKLLLDTHIWIWFLQDPGRLAPSVRRELADQANELWISPISVWEALNLRRKGRIATSGDFTTWLERSTPGIFQAPLTHQIVVATEHLNLHSDPADRFLAATAQVLDLTLVTADARLLGLGTIRTLGNR